MDKKDRYYHLVNFIRDNSSSKPKRHGEYIRLEMFDSWSLELDTWNKSIYVYDSDKFIGSLGIDFSGFNCNSIMVEFWIAHLHLAKIKIQNSF